MAKNQSIKQTLRQNLSKEKQQIKHEIIEEVRRLNDEYSAELNDALKEFRTVVDNQGSIFMRLKRKLENLTSSVTTMNLDIREQHSLNIYLYIGGTILSGCVSALTMYLLLKI